MGAGLIRKRHFHRPMMIDEALDLHGKVSEWVEPRNGVSSPSFRMRRRRQDFKCWVLFLFMKLLKVKDSPVYHRRQSRLSFGTLCLAADAPPSGWYLFITSL